MPSETIAADAPPASPRLAAAAALERAISALTVVSSDTEAVRVARRSIKRVEAILGIFEDDASKAIVVEAKSVRKALGALRDQQAMESHLSALKLPQETASALALALRRAEAARGASAQYPLASAAGTLRRLAVALEAATDPPDGVQLALRRLLTLYAAARQKGQRAFASGTAKDLHDLRTAVGRFGDLASALKPEAITDVEALSALKRSLGEHHDLSVLWAFLRERPELLKLEKDSLRRALRQRRERLERRSEKAFSTLFALTPKAFARAMRDSASPADSGL